MSPSTISPYPRAVCTCTHAPCRPDRQVENTRRLHLFVSYPLTRYSSYQILALTDGDHDWMDPKGGMQSIEKLRQVGNDNAKMYLVNNAGHHG